MPVKPALVHSVMAAEPEAATTLLQLLYETLEQVARPHASKTETRVLDLNEPVPEPEEEQQQEEEETEQVYEADFLDLMAEPNLADLAADPEPYRPEAGPGAGPAPGSSPAEPARKPK